jgi:fluoroacetyl-CoA thioesterase
MQHSFKKGDQKQFSKTILATDIAAFASGIVHEVYATFCLARDAEWCSRLFVLDMKSTEEEGIGTQLTVIHHSPAFIGETIVFTTLFDHITPNNEIITTYTATVNNRLIASGVQGQKILPKKKLDAIFNKIFNGNQ